MIDKSYKNAKKKVYKNKNSVFGWKFGTQNCYLVQNELFPDVESFSFMSACACCVVKSTLCYAISKDNTFIIPLKMEGIQFYF
jgi:hypothetical protein